MIDFKNTQLLGHRGARIEALENTLFGFQHANLLQAKGLAGVEFDVQLTADGHLIVFHDDTLQRLCGLQARVDQLNLREIQRHTQSGHPIVTLDRLADILTPFTHIELEIKTHNRTHYPKLIKALRQYLVDSPLSVLPLVLTSFDLQLLAQLQRHQELSLIPRGLLVREPSSIAAAPNTAQRLGCTQLGIYYLLLNERIIQYCHRYQLPVTAWTANDIDSIKQLINWQVDVIITDIPSQLL